MQLRRWNELPGVMRTREVRKYYNIIKKRQMSLKIKRLFDIVVASIMPVSYTHIDVYKRQKQSSSHLEPMILHR